MASKLVLFADGTGNSSRSSEKTNVWRIFEALDQGDPKQLCIYSDGVGTSSNRILAAIGGATGWGVKKNVLTLYKFLCRNYPNRAPGSIGPIANEDRPAIYAFGFSRGAFTIRVLVGLVDHAGLVTFGTEEELSHNAAAAYRSFRSASLKSWSPLVVVGRLVRDGLVWLNDRRRGCRVFSAVQAQIEKSGRKDIPIAFLGLWDTVEAYGMPIEELKRVVDLAFWPLLFDDFKLSGHVNRARHALSLDDERATFWPIPWNEQKETKTQPPRIQQVWFAGVHSNLGGGYPEDRLSYVSLVWMINEAKAAGLDFTKGTLEDYTRERSPYAKIYDSRAGLASYYRYRPRRIATDRDANQVVPLVHHSVIERMAFGSDKYAPITLPSHFNVLLPNGTTEPMTGFAQAVAPAPPKGQTAAMSRYRAARQAIKEGDAEAVSLVWDTVWWRRLNYFVTVAATACLVAFPWVGGPLSRVINSLPGLGTTEESDTAAGGPLSSVVDALGGFLPAYAKPWTTALVDYPLEFAAIGAMFLIAFFMGGLLQTRIAGIARFAWDRTLINDYLDWIDQNNKGWRNSLIMLLAASIIIAIAWKFLGSANDTPYVVAWSILAVLFAASLARQIAMVKAFEVKRANDLTSTTLPSTATLKFARAVRSSAWITTTFEILTNGVAPIAFAVILIAAGLLFINGALFDGLDSAASYCSGTPRLDGKDIERVGEVKDLPLDQLCNATGLMLVEGHRYRIGVEVAQPWFDKSVMTDAAGFEADGFRHLLATPWKRRWSERWFQPIVRIGRYGNDEYLVKSKEVVASYTVTGCPAEAKSSTTVLAAIRDIAAKVSDQCVSETLGIAKDIAESGRLEPRNLIWTEITAQDTGELFFYVNDAVLPLLALSGLFYSNNRGTANVRVTRLRD